MWSDSSYEHHMKADVEKHNKNVQSGKPICPRCEGTGNEFFSMYKECTLCSGTGVLRKPQ